MKIEIRKFNLADRAELRKICWDTSFLENPTEFVDEEELLCDFLSIYFTDYEPQSSFVAVDQGKVVGYIIGTKNVVNMQRIFSFKILPHLFMKTLQAGALLKKKNLKFLFYVLQSAIRGEFFAPNLTSFYPASFHINIDKGYRRMQVGKKLVETYIQFLQENGIRGVYLGTMNESARNFFSKLNFKVLYQSQRTYLRYRLDHPVTSYIFGRIL